MEEKINIIRLIRSRNVNCNLFFKILQQYGNATNFIRNFHTFKSRKEIELISENDILEEIKATEKYGAKIITFLDKEYPEYLKNIECFPPAITVKGNIDLMHNEKILAVVGSRNTSINNYNFTKKIAKELGSLGYVITSGLARGIDSSAHIGSLKTGTIGVLGGGIDVIYPKENENLYHNILDEGGLLISENYFKCPPRPEYFPSRNRIIAGISKGLLLVDAGLMSGSLNTARQAIKFNRELMVFPGSPYDERCYGSNRLLQEGANLVLNTKDIMECMENYNITNIFKDENSEFINSLNEDEKSEEIFSCLKQDEANNCDEEEIKNVILSKLDLTPTDVNDLIDEIIGNYDINIINSAIMILKLEEKIIFEGNKIFLKSC